LEGSFATDWDWDAHVSYGRNDYTYNSRNNPIRANLAFAVDAVRDDNGNIACAATIPGHPRFDPAAAGCVPLNLFGEGSPSKEAPEHRPAAPYGEGVYTQAASGATLQGKLASTGASPIAVATGVEYRKEEDLGSAGRIASGGGYFSRNTLPYS